MCVHRHNFCLLSRLWLEGSVVVFLVFFLFLLPSVCETFLQCGACVVFAVARGRSEHRAASPHYFQSCLRTKAAVPHSGALTDVIGT